MIKGSNCKICETVFIPKRHLCLKCRKETMPVEVDSAGVLLSYTTLYVTTPQFTPPIFLALVELTKSKAKILCRGDENLKLEIGDVVKVEEEPDELYILRRC